MSRPRLLTVLWRPTRRGGVPVVMRGFLEHFDRDALDVHVCTIRRLYDEDRVEDLGPGITWHPLELDGPRSPVHRVRSMIGVARVAARIRPDILHLHSGTASYGLMAIATARGAGRVIEVHDAPQSHRLSRANQALEKRYARRLGFRPLVHSSAVRDDTARAWGIPPERFRLVPLGIDTRAFAPDPGAGATERTRLGLPDGAPVVSYVARIVPEKRPALFLEVADRVLRSHPDVHFVLAGAGADLEATREQARSMKHGDRVVVPGFVSDLPAIYHASNLFLSTSRYEGFGLGVAEAMAAGLPVVATDVGGVSDVVGGAGILERDDDPDPLAEHVRDLLDDPERMARLGAMALERAREHLDVRTMVRAFQRVFLEAAR